MSTKTEVALLDEWHILEQAATEAALESDSARAAARWAEERQEAARDAASGARDRWREARAKALRDADKAAEDKK